MLSGEGFTLLGDNLTGQMLEILFDLFTGFSQQHVPLLDLSLQSRTGSLQGGVFGIKLAAFFGQLSSFRSQPLDFKIVGSRDLLQPF